MADRNVKDGRAWRIGSDADVEWIADGTSRDRTITAAIPPVFDAYATIVLPGCGEDQEEHDGAVLALLSEQSARQRWWLGYLDTGADDIVFPRAPTVTLYAGWHYVLVEAGPEQAATWRHSDGRTFWKGVLPNLMFPADQSWLASTLWDDDWTCIGGPASLVGRFLRHPRLQARAVELRRRHSTRSPGVLTHTGMPLPVATRVTKRSTQRHDRVNWPGRLGFRHSARGCRFGCAIPA